MSDAGHASLPLPERGGESKGLSAADALEGRGIAGESLDRTRRTALAPPVAAALRAALDWLVGERGAGRPLGVRIQESLIEVTCARVDPDGLHAATEVLAAVQGNLGPQDGLPKGAWRLRVPTLSERPTYLMVILAGEPIALPWHSVLRVVMATPDDLLSLERQEGAPIVELAPPPHPRRGDVPLVCVGHGRKSGWLVADRLVWRLEGIPVGAPPRAPWPGLARAVSAEDHEIYWVAEPAWVLRDVPVPPLPAFDPAAQPAPHESGAGSAAHSGMPLAEDPQGPPLPELTFQNVRPIDRAEGAPSAAPHARARAARESERPAPAAVAAPVPARASRAPEAPPMPSSTGDRRTRSRRVEDRARRGASVETPRERRLSRSGPPVRIVAPQPTDRPLALVAEDSITARIFLTRMLEQGGFEVEAVNTAAELLLLLPQRSWALVCVDVDLPDGRGEPLLRMVTDVAGSQGPSLVALVRDDEDAAAARAAGVSRMLHKPFDLDALTALLTRLGLGASRQR